MKRPAFIRTCVQIKLKITQRRIKQVFIILPQKKKKSLQLLEIISNKTFAAMNSTEKYFLFHTSE